MNILMLAEVSAYNVIGGASRLLREQAIGLKERGHSVSLIVRAPRSDSPTIVDINGITEFRYGVNRGSALAFVLSSMRGSLRLFDHVSKTTPPDVVIVHQSLAGIGPLCFRHSDSPHRIYACHSLVHEEFLSRNPPAAGLPARLWRRIHTMARFRVEHMAVLRCDAVVVESRFMKERVMVNHGVPAERIHVVPGAADPRRFRPPADKKEARVRIGLPADRMVLFTVRNLMPRMGLDNLIRAMAELAPSNEDLVLVIGGSGPLRSSLEKLIQALGLSSVVTLKGFIPEDDLATFYQGADLVVMPTGELEGFGLVTVEALACGTPVLGTPVGAIPEVLSQLDPILLSSGSDPRSLADALGNVIARIRSDPVYWNTLCRKGLQLVGSAYNWRAHCEKVENVILATKCSVPGHRPSRQ